jgi:hypothetical protein
VIAAIPDECGSTTSVQAERASNCNYLLERRRLGGNAHGRNGHIRMATAATNKYGALKTCRHFLAKMSQRITLIHISGTEEMSLNVMIGKGMPISACRMTIF